MHAVFLIPNMMGGDAERVRLALAGVFIARCYKASIVPQRHVDGPALSRDAGGSLWNGRKGPRFLNVGPFKGQKNHSLLLRAFARVARERPDAALALVGMGDLLDPIRALAGELGIADRVLFPGFVLEPAPWFHSADTLVLSSNYEGFGNVLVEAMEAGLAVVATDCERGPAEVLDDSRYGTLVPPNDDAALAAAMLAAIDSPSRVDFVRRRAQDFAPERAVAACAALLAEIGLPPKA